MCEIITHPIPPVWNSESRILLLGTMPSPASRNAGFFYMHAQNRFWRVLFAVFGEKLIYTNKGFFITEDSEKAEREKSAKAQAKAAMQERADLAAAIKERRDFLIRHHIALWQKHCADTYEERFNLTSQCLPSTSPANAAWSLDRLIEAYSVLRKGN